MQRRTRWRLGGRRLKAAWAARQAGASGVGRVAFAGGELVGFVQFGPPGTYPRRLEYDRGPVSDDALFVACLFVRPEQPGRGLARRLLGAAEEAAARSGRAAVETFARRGSANNPSGQLEIHRACGFRVLRDASEFPLVRREVVEGPVGPTLP